MPSGISTAALSVMAKKKKSFIYMCVCVYKSEMINCDTFRIELNTRVKTI